MFYSCSSLEAVSLPEGLRSIGYSAFYKCESLKNIRLPSGLETIEARCFEHSGLEEMVLPANTRKVGPHAFCGCNNLKTVQLNEELDKLGEKETVDGEEYEGGTFADSAIESVRLPSALKRIETETFRDCKKLRSIEIQSGVEYIGRKCFSSTAIEKI